MPRVPKVDEGLIHAYLDGALRDEDAAKIEELLAASDDWTRALTEARQLAAQTQKILQRAKPGERPAPGLHAAVKHSQPKAPRASQAPAPTPVRDVPTSRLRYLAWAATVIIAVGGGWFARGMFGGLSAAGIEGNLALRADAKSATAEGAAAAADSAPVALATARSRDEATPPAAEPGAAQAVSPAAPGRSRETTLARVDSLAPTAARQDTPTGAVSLASAAPRPADSQVDRADSAPAALPPIARALEERAAETDDDRAQGRRSTVLAPPLETIPFYRVVGQTDQAGPLLVVTHVGVTNGDTLTVTYDAADELDLVQARQPSGVLPTNEIGRVDRIVGPYRVTLRGRLPQDSLVTIIQRLRAGT